ncbi:MAG TPA: FmdE family protein [Humidesulfovibrio sp.]|uniref:FmdE family protein n=1 Tax=Humidesulfovibrio sp. TaxID=2910988 RepID=UPI002CD9280E|nr:FmdE family protein [Humidesulfovibrio sp.]HWR03488.1 FmdE family protein [Humidesulfovibrio sp.]
MNIGPYTFEEFKAKAAAFHGYPAPGLLLGGYMVELARRQLPEGTLFDAVVETSKCLPDAVQILTPCTLGNGWMKVLNLGRYAVTLYDKYTGTGVRVWLDLDKMAPYEEIRGWFLKLKKKADQDTDRLFREIEDGGENLCSMAAVQVDDRFRKHKSMGRVGICPICAEAYPPSDGAICRGCQGEAPYGQPGCETPAGARCETAPHAKAQADAGPQLTAVPVSEAVGHKTLHDMTRIVAGESKGVEFHKGHAISGGDVCRLQTMGRAHVYLEQETPSGFIHENEAALAFAKLMAGENVTFDETPHEGKINFRATKTGVLVLDRERQEAFNLVPDVMAASRHHGVLVEEGKELAGARAIPLYLSAENFRKAQALLAAGPLYNIAAIKPARVGVLVTGTEVFQGLIEDKFAPVIREKVERLGSQVVVVDIVPDDAERIAQSVGKMLTAGADLIVTTAGLSVDPDDVTRKGLLAAGLTDMLYGAPLLPGAMTLLGRLACPAGSARVMGVPACALFHKATSFDILLPRVLAGVDLKRADLAEMAEGGFCLNCKTCVYPKCCFGK